MSGDVEFGSCDICDKEAPLQRKYYHYGIKCECHSPDHFEIVSHCADCTPKPPSSTTISMEPEIGPEERNWNILDLNYDLASNDRNDVDVRAILLCIQAWHEMINPGHHHIVVHADGSGNVVAAPNAFGYGKIPLADRPPIIQFRSLKDFIDQTYSRLRDEGWKVIDTAKENPDDEN